MLEPLRSPTAPVRPWAHSGGRERAHEAHCCEVELDRPQRSAGPHAGRGFALPLHRMPRCQPLALLPRLHDHPGDRLGCGAAPSGRCELLQVVVVGVLVAVVVVAKPRQVVVQVARAGPLPSLLHLQLLLQVVVEAAQAVPPPPLLPLLLPAA